MQGSSEGQAAAVHGWLLTACPQQGQHCAVAVPVLISPCQELHPWLVRTGIDGEEGFTHPLPPQWGPRAVQGFDAEPHVVVLVVLAVT